MANLYIENRDRWEQLSEVLTISVRSQMPGWLSMRGIAMPLAITKIVKSLMLLKGNLMW